MFSLEYAEEHQQRSSELILINEKISFSKGSSTNNLHHAYIMDYPTKGNFKNYEFSLSVKSVIQIRNLKTKYL